MTQTSYDVVAVGNAIIDILKAVPDTFLAVEDITKSAMTLIDEPRADHLTAAFGADATVAAGGSAANTMTGVASFGGRAAYIGKVSNDELGDVFGHDLRAVGVQFRAGRPEADVPTGRCIIVVTPDAQRTMNTYLGVSSLLHPDDLDEAVAEVANFYRNFHSYRYVGRRLVMRLQRAVTPELLGHLNAEFTDLIEEGAYHKLPGGIYDTSYIRQYAQAAGVDESTLLQSYRQYTQAHA